MGHVGSKTRSLGLFSMKPCSHFRGHSVASVSMELYKKVFLMLSLSSLNIDLAGSKTRSLGQISLKPFSPSEATVFLQS